MRITNPFDALRRLLAAAREPRPIRLDVHGRDDKCRLSLPLVARIVEEIDADGIHRSEGTRLILDGCSLADLVERLRDEALRGENDLTLLECRALRAVRRVAIESAALTFRGDVVVTECPEDLVARAQQRGEEVGFRRVGVILGLADRAATRSGRPMSGATAR